MKASQFSFDLPQELIAQEPAPDRDGARLLVMDRQTGRTADSSVRDLPTWIEPGTVMVFNDTRVRKARLFAQGPGGTLCEFLLLEQRDATLWEALVGRARRARRGSQFLFPTGIAGRIEEEIGEARLIRFDRPIDEGWLDQNGHVPLPPYIRRKDRAEDEARYQTVFNRNPGSAAAPTAGLHFTQGLLERLREGGATIAWITLHVGLGTFQPIRTEEIEDHRMHEERFHVPEETRRILEEGMGRGARVIGVGTTVVRALESAWSAQGLRTGAGKTRLFITPGYRFRVVNGMFTNFHTPGSSLLVLVSAFAGRERILEAYAEAIRKRYRFFSYGDAMLIR